MLGKTDEKEDTKKLAQRMTQAFNKQPTRPGSRARSGMGTVSHSSPYGPGGITGNSGSGIRRPATMGDVFRYNRETKEKNTADQLAQQQAKTNLAALSTGSQVSHFQRSDDEASRRTTMTDEISRRNAGLTLDRNAQIAKTEDARQKVAESEATSQQALRGARGELIGQQVQLAEQTIDANASQAQIQDEVSKARLALANDPTNPELNTRLQALTGQGAKPASELDKSKISSAEMGDFLKFAQANNTTLGGVPKTHAELMNEFLKLKQQQKQGLRKQEVPAEGYDELDYDYDERINSYF